MKNQQRNEENIHSIVSTFQKKSLERQKEIVLKLRDLVHSLKNTRQGAIYKTLIVVVKEIVISLDPSIKEEFAQEISQDEQLSIDLFDCFMNDKEEVSYHLISKNYPYEEDKINAIISEDNINLAKIIAMRGDNAPSTIAKLIDLKNQDIIEILLKNLSIQFSQDDLEKIESSFRQEKIVQKLVFLRSKTLTPFTHLTEWVIVDELRRNFIDFSEIYTELLVEDIVDISLQNIFQIFVDQLVSAVESENKLKSLIKKHIYTSGMLIRLLYDKKYILFLKLFAKYTDLPPTMVEKIILNHSYEGLILVCKANNFQPSELAVILRLLNQLKPNHKYKNSINKGLSLFDKTKKEVAVKVVQNWKKDPQYFHSLFKNDISYQDYLSVTEKKHAG